MGLGPPSTLRRTADSIDCDKSTIACNRRWRLSLGPLPYVPSFNDLRDLLTPKPKRSSLLPRGRNIIVPGGHPGPFVVQTRRYILGRNASAC